jgi:hypothetical protein
LCASICRYWQFLMDFDALMTYSTEKNPQLSHEMSMRK